MSFGLNIVKARDNGPGARNDGNPNSRPGLVFSTPAMTGQRNQYDGSDAPTSQYTSGPGTVYSGDTGYSAYSDYGNNNDTDDDGPIPAGRAGRKNMPQPVVTRPKAVQARFDQVLVARDREREQAVSAGLLARPGQRRTLASAVAPVGKCMAMCPEFERLERMLSGSVWGPEKMALTDDQGRRSGEMVPVERRMVKVFRRAAAGVDEQLPSDLRPPGVLQETVDFLFHDVVPSSRLAEIQYFLWDRTRAIRNDFSIQQVSSMADVRIAIDAYERIVRFHLTSLQILTPPEPFDEKYEWFQNREQLDRALLSLLTYYDSHRTRFAAPNEAEFRSYWIILGIGSPAQDVHDKMQLWPIEITRDARVQRALRLYNAATSVLLPVGPSKESPRPVLVAQENWKRFWTLIESHETSYLMAAAAAEVFGMVRRMTLSTLWRAYRVKNNRQVDDWTVASLVFALGLDSPSQVADLAVQFGMGIEKREDGEDFLDLSLLGQGPFPANKTARRVKSFRLVEAKRYRRTIEAIIDGMSVVEARKRGMIVPDYERMTEIAAEELPFGDPYEPFPPRADDLFVADESEDERLVEPDVVNVAVQPASPARSVDDSENESRIGAVPPSTIDPHDRINGEETTTSPSTAGPISHSGVTVIFKTGAGLEDRQPRPMFRPIPSHLQSTTVASVPNELEQAQLSAGADGPAYKALWDGPNLDSPLDSTGPNRTAGPGAADENKTDGVDGIDALPGKLVSVPPAMYRRPAGTGVRGAITGDTAIGKTMPPTMRSAILQGLHEARLKADRDVVFDSTAEALWNGEHGLMAQFVEFVAGPEIRRALDEEEKAKEEAIVNRLRGARLSRKYGRRWAEVVYDRALARRAAAKRRRLAALVPNTQPVVDRRVDKAGVGEDDSGSDDDSAIAGRTGVDSREGQLDQLFNSTLIASPSPANNGRDHVRVANATKTPFFRLLAMGVTVDLASKTGFKKQHARKRSWLEAMRTTRTTESPEDEVDHHLDRTDEIGIGVPFNMSTNSTSREVAGRPPPIPVAVLDRSLDEGTDQLLFDRVRRLTDALDEGTKMLRTERDRLGDVTDPTTTALATDVVDRRQSRFSFSTESQTGRLRFPDPSPVRSVAATTTTIAESSSEFRPGSPNLSTFSAGVAKYRARLRQLTSSTQSSSLPVGRTIPGPNHSKSDSTGGAAYWARASRFVDRGFRQSLTLDSVFGPTSRSKDSIIRNIGSTSSLSHPYPTIQNGYIHTTERTDQSIEDEIDHLTGSTGSTVINGEITDFGQTVWRPQRSTQDEKESDQVGPFSFSTDEGEAGESDGGESEQEYLAGGLGEDDPIEL